MAGFAWTDLQIIIVSSVSRRMKQKGLVVSVLLLLNCIIKETIDFLQCTTRKPPDQLLFRYFIEWNREQAKERECNRI